MASISPSVQNLGLIRQATGKAVLEEIAIPDLRDEYILVRTVALAVNPTDWTTLDAPGDNGTLVGCDYAGVVEKVGKAVKKEFKVGDRVCGFIHGANDANPQDGAFAKYVAAKGDLQMHIPEGISFEEACTVGVGSGTAGYALYKELGLSRPEERDNSNSDQETILIYGGSTATGTLAIQYAKLSGYKVATTCSPKSFDLVKERGADMVFDYRDPEVGAKIRSATNDQITKAFDTVSTESSAKICAEAIGSSGGVFCNLLGRYDCPRSDVETRFFLLYSMPGEAHIYEGVSYDAAPEDFEFGVDFLGTAGKLWAQGKWKAHPQRLMPGGLSGLNDGFEEMRQGRVSGEKLVYRIAETQWP